MYIYSTNQSLWLDRQNKKCTVYPVITGIQKQKTPTLANWGFVAREGHDPSTSEL